MNNPLPTLCAVFGAVALAAFLWLWALTLPDVNPPNWIRILGVIWLPIGIGGAAVTGILGWRGAGRVRSVVGLSLAALAVIAFITLVATADY
jgi:hypothetical protein